MLYRTRYVSLLLFLVAASCSIDDGDRCVPGYSWISDYTMCLIDTDTNQRDTQANGLGVPCLKDDDCQGFEANWCLLNPLDPEAAGMCSILNCVPSDCTGENTCVDCTSVQNDLVETRSPFCIANSRLGLLSSLNCTWDE